MPNGHTPRTLYVDDLDARSRGQNLKGNIKEESQAINITFIRQAGGVKSRAWLLTPFGWAQQLCLQHATQSGLVRRLQVTLSKVGGRIVEKTQIYGENPIALNPAQIGFFCHL